jgi:predicted nuclease of predicted toxin-antitoxin system
VKLLIDNQLPAALARALAAMGHDAVHVLDLGMGQETDRLIWMEAAHQQRIVVSKDEDFLFLATQPDESGRLLWLRIGNTRKAELLNAILPRMTEIEALFTQGQRIVEVRG